jgi:hypothetical protein
MPWLWLQLHNRHHEVMAWHEGPDEVMRRPACCAGPAHPSGISHQKHEFISERSRMLPAGNLGSPCPLPATRDDVYLSGCSQLCTVTCPLRVEA